MLKPFYSNFKIKNKIFSISLLLLLIFCLIGMVTYHYFTNLYEKRIYEESADMLQLSSTVLDEELKKIENLSFQVSTDTLVQEYMETINERKIGFEDYKTKANLLERLLTFAASERYISSIQIIDIYGKKYTTGYNTKIENDADKIKRLVSASEGSNTWSRIDGKNGLSSARQIRKKANVSLSNMGILIISLDMDKFVEQTLDFSKNKNFIITDGNEIFYQNEGSTIMDSHDFPKESIENGYKIEEMEGKDYLLTYKHSRFSQMTYYHLLPFDNITKQSQTIKRIMIVCFLFMLTLTILLSRRAAQNISKPLEELSTRMKQVQDGDFEEPEAIPEKYHNDEVGLLHINFRLMLDKINELIKENYTKQLIIKETEYKALQAQINPHFLYNTLDSINWLAKINQQEKISVMAEALGNMMRNIISKKAAMITVKEELEIVRNYITIQQYRYEKRLDFTLDTSITHEGSQIPKLTIQPIVENAIQHGLEEMVTKCHVSVTVLAIGENLQITVEDNGPGIDESKLEGIYRGKIKSKSSGIGLNNINERIKLMFGDTYGVNIESRLGAGTKVKILLPYMAG
ncbi:cache domain-containing sensor histidine kinase [Sediminibacillus albus]|uniref:histidine kinase n=1 Tax=Sediminibacillus albus TaxID=407036 RepID=A0A1G8WHW4_9BACI|nr:sensor histidine kinase [Sediminibacillus albus]SDJ77912.1 two-component system, sensor histidine kinase YesM [Sediminibacillus albus]